MSAGETLEEYCARTWEAWKRSQAREAAHRPLGYADCVHHLGGDPGNNDLANLRIARRWDPA